MRRSNLFLTPSKSISRLFPVVLWLMSFSAFGGGGPLGIDHRLAFDDSGIWKRSNQTGLQNLMIAGVVAGAVWEGGETRLGRTYWQSVDSLLLSSVAATGLKYTFSRKRPTETENPNEWFKGKGHYSFPSGEVAAITGIVTPFVLEYGKDHPSVYLLEALPLYDAIARMKVRAHWQTDVLAAFAVGSASGYYAHDRNSPFVLSYLPNSFFVGFKTKW